MLTSAFDFSSIEWSIQTISIVNTVDALKAAFQAIFKINRELPSLISSLFDQGKKDEGHRVQALYRRSQETFRKSLEKPLVEDNTGYLVTFIEGLSMVAPSFPDNTMRIWCWKNAARAFISRSDTMPKETV